MRTIRGWAKVVLLLIWQLVNAGFFRVYACRRDADTIRPQIVRTKLSGARIVVIAPHPDDEMIGCGGAILEFLSRKVSLDIVYLTAGQKRGSPGLSQHGIAEQRKMEAIGAARLCGLDASKLHFLSGEDGNLLNSDIQASFQRVLEVVKPDTIFIPCLLDTHIDHYAASIKLFEIWQSESNILSGCRLFLYESQSPLTPWYSNTVLDISRWRSQKREIVSVFRSQGDLRFTSNLNRANSLFFPGSMACELYIDVGIEEYFHWYLDNYRQEKDYHQLRAKLVANADSRTLIRSFISSRSAKTTLRALL